MGERTVVLTTFQSPIEANIARTRLEEHGIRCRLDDEQLLSNHALLGAALGGVKLMVNEDDAEEAARILSEPLDEELSDFADFDWDEDLPDEADDAKELVGSALSCPKCHSEEIGFGSAFHWYWSGMLFLLVAPFVIQRTPVTAWLLDVELVALPTGLFVGVWLAVFQVFPLRCKECGAQGKRKLFKGNPPRDDKKAS